MDPVNTDGQNPEDSTIPDSDAGTTIPKFKSAEDRDKAYLELEKTTTAQNQKLADMERMMEDFKASTANQQQQPPQDNRSFTDQYKSQEDLKKFWSEFAEKPQEVFGGWAARTMAEMENRIAARDSARDSIAEFKTKYPDLAPYDEIVSIYVARQLGNLSPREKLERAAPEARKMIASIAQKQGSQGAQGMDPETFVESPSGNRDSTPRINAKQEEDSLTEYLREQAAFMAKKATPPRMK